MKNQDIKINLGAVQETLILPLWARAREMEKNNPIVFDTYARDIVAKIDYDFSTIEAGQVADHQVVYPIRDYNFDNIVRRTAVLWLSTSELVWIPRFSELTTVTFYGSTSTCPMSLLCEIG